MTVYVIRNGRLVRKETSAKKLPSQNFPTPMLSRLEPYESPITGKEVSSWRERDRELAANDCYDPRDFSGSYARGRHRMKEEADSGREQQSDAFEWRDPV
jgi:hypothetical protein